MPARNHPREVVIDYTNHRGERSERTILPVPNSLRYGESEWHPGPRWLIDAFDMDKDGAGRTFAMDDIHSWRPLLKEGADGRQ